MSCENPSSVLPPPIDPAALSAAVAEPYDNRSLASANDHEVRMSVMTHGFPWHQHPDSDEIFLVLEGILAIEFRDGEVLLRPGQMLKVPARLPHRTRPIGERSVNLTFERAAAATVFEE
ncbi:MAG: cupin domain-containing protein [Gemmatimonadaceae bacterium]|nr:cupin domain-containing protein [Gemmatimonadaceae bacterium]